MGSVVHHPSPSDHREASPCSCCWCRPWAPVRIQPPPTYALASVIICDLRSVIVITDHCGSSRHRDSGHRPRPPPQPLRPSLGSPVFLPLVLPPGPGEDATTAHLRTSDGAPRAPVACWPGRCVRPSARPPSGSHARGRCRGPGIGGAPDSDVRGHVRVQRGPHGRHRPAPERTGRHLVERP